MAKIVLFSDFLPLKQKLMKQRMLSQASWREVKYKENVHADRVIIKGEKTKKRERKVVRKTAKWLVVVVAKCGIIGIRFISCHGFPSPPFFHYYTSGLVAFSPLFQDFHENWRYTFCGKWFLLSNCFGKFQIVFRALQIFLQNYTPCDVLFTEFALQSINGSYEFSQERFLYFPW